MLEDERHARRVQNLLLRLGLDGIPGKEDDGLFVDAKHQALPLEGDPKPLQGSWICCAPQASRVSGSVPLWIVGVDADQDVGRDEIALLARPKLPDGNGDDENDGGERQPEKHVGK
jgi:hypothetical protein